MFPVEGFAGRDTGAVSSQSREFIPSRFSLPVLFRVIALCQGQALDCGSPDTFIHLDRYRCSCRWCLTCALCKLVCANFLRGRLFRVFDIQLCFVTHDFTLTDYLLCTGKAGGVALHYYLHEMQHVCNPKIMRHICVGS